MARRRRAMLQEEEGENFWPSFTDLISTIALILFVLVLLAFIQNLISGKNLAYIRSQLEGATKQLGNSRAALATSEQRLKTLAAEIEAGQAQLRLSEAKVAAQETAIADSNLQLDALRTRLRGIALLRLDVLDNVKKSLETQLKSGKGPALTVAENGNIVLNENLVFEYNSYTIKREGKALLKELATTFGKVLADPAVRANIDVILVQGHTDERGSEAYNRELSAKRANTVLDFMLDADKTLAKDYAAMFASSAYSKSRPLNTAHNEQAYEQNRRIEISIVLKDASVRGLIDDYMKSVPVPAPAP